MSSALCRLLGFLRRSRFRPAAPPARERIWPGHPGWSVKRKTGLWVWNAYPGYWRDPSWSGGHDPEGRAFGKGVLTFVHHDGLDRYEGMLEAGKMNGEGWLLSADGCRAEGTWMDGVLCGPGGLLFPNGDLCRISGSWRRQRWTFISPLGTTRLRSRRSFLRVGLGRRTESHRY